FAHLKNCSIVASFLTIPLAFVETFSYHTKNTLGPIVEASSHSGNTAESKQVIDPTQETPGGIYRTISFSVINF
ncbi:MAG TPA: hypothetical protein VEC93_22065, partial [Anaerolineae bacterium]|nr:hypothetical protein [Anaerolineae bacterium]